MSTSSRRSPVYRVSHILTWLVYAFAVSAIAFLTTAFVLELFNANESAPFVQWVDRATTILMQPFRGIFPSAEAVNGSVFDAALLFAILMYGFLAMGMHALLAWIDRKMAAARYAEIDARAEAATNAALARSPEPSVHDPSAPYIAVPEAAPRSTSPSTPGPTSR
jgi:uncharacterized protein YggT (Ycf19 family)